MRTGRLLLAIGCALSVIATEAQQYAFRQFTPREGLAQSQVRCMAQDAEGHLWVGTLGGASRFDGAAFTNYALQEGLPDAQVGAMLLRRDGSFWLGTGASLAMFNGRSMQAITLPERFAAMRVQALAEVNGVLFVGMDAGGLLMSHSDGFVPVPSFPVDSVKNVRVLQPLKDGSLLIGTRNGLFKYRDGKFAYVPIGTTQLSISALAEAGDGSIWVGTFGDGVFHLRADGTLEEIDERNGLLQNNVRAMAVDERGRLWIGSKFGVNIWEAGRLRAFTVHQGMPNDNVYCLFKDNEGGMWIGTDGSGLLRFAGDRFVTWTVTDGLCSDLVMTMVADARGDLWLGTYANGVCRLDGMAMLTTADGLLNNTVWCSLADADSSLWFGTSEGLCHVVNGMIAPLDTQHRMFGERVLSLYRDADGSRWCGAREGLVIFRADGRIERVEEVDGIGLRAVRAIISDGSGGHWLATELGLVRLNGEGGQRWTTKEGLCDNTIFSLLKDARGRLWLGTSNGLSCFDGKTFTNIRLGPDFGSNYVDLLLGDKQGRIWAGTNNGAFLFRADELIADPTKAEHIGLIDGFRGSECNLNAGFVAKDGKVLLGTNAGLVMHDPARDLKQAQPAPPMARIFGTRSYLQRTDWAGYTDSIVTRSGLPAGLKLPFKRNHITFDFTAVALSDADRVRFQYRLVGADPDWLPPSEARFASYSNLSQGDYEFQVRAIDRSGLIGPPASFTFTITPPFWLRWWFFALVALVGASITVAIMRFRAVRRQRAEKTRQLMLRSRMLQLEQQALNANMNRHFIFNALNSIQYYINRQDRTTANRYLTSFAKLIRKNLDASQADTTTLAEELERLELYLILEHMRFKDKFRYALDIDEDVNTQDVDIPAMMLQPYVENSIWHGILPMERQGFVQISIMPGSDGRVQIVISDDGVGIEQSLASKTGPADHISRGIEITKGRADVLRRLELADIRIVGPEETRNESGQPSGTRVTIELPSKKGPLGNGQHLVSVGAHHTFTRS